MRAKGIWLVVAAACVGALFSNASVFADTLSSSSYKINGSFGASFGDSTSSSSYELVSSGGEPIIGSGAGGSYLLGQGYVSQLQNGLSLSVQPNGLISYFPLDEVVTDGQPVFNGGNTSSSPLISKSGATLTTGKIGSALQLNGSSQYMTDNPSTTSYDSVTNTAGTVEFWFKAAAALGHPQFLVTKEGTCTGWRTDIDTSGHVSAMLSSTASVCGSAVYTTLTSPLTYVDNAWHHVAITVNRSTSSFILYVDGQSVASSSTVPAGGAAGGSLQLGADSANTNLLTGSLDEVKIFGRELTAGEVKGEYDAAGLGIPAGLTFGTIIPGVSGSVSADIIVQSDSSKYSLAVNQNNDLTNGSNTVSAVSGSIASPVTWSEGTTKGLGFSLTSAPGIDAKWGTGANYAAFPGTATTFYSRSGGGSPVNDTITMRLRVDTPSTQPSGVYNNQVTITGTIVP